MYLHCRFTPNVLELGDHPRLSSNVLVRAFKNCQVYWPYESMYVSQDGHYQC